MFNTPIPGQSLTSEPGNYPWEKPSQINSPEEAAMFTLENLNNPKKMNATLDILELGMDLVDLTEGILRNNVAQGIHSIDVSLLIAPIVYEFIKGEADRSNIDYDDGLKDNDEDRTQIEKIIRRKKSLKDIESLKEKNIIKDMSKDMDITSMEDIPTEKEITTNNTPEDIPEGLMSRQRSAM
jgi:hypothetical protein